jgi:hypothetical protein
MTSRQAYRLKDHEGRRVNLALADGSRLDGCFLVSVGRGGAESAWITAGDVDLFVPWTDVVELWAS